MVWSRSGLGFFPVSGPDFQALDASHPSTSPENKGPLEEGLRAYALRQAYVRQRLFTTFAKQWHDVPAFIEMADRGLAGGEEEEEAVNSTV